MRSGPAHLFKRRRWQKGVLAFFARDADAHWLARLIAWAKVRLRRRGQNDETKSDTATLDRTRSAVASMAYTPRYGRQ